MSGCAKWMILIALAAAAGEVALAVELGPVWFAGATPPMFLVFLAGPLVFLALIAWRRHDHPVRPKLLLVVVAVLAVIGLGVLLLDYIRFRADVPPKPGSHVNPLLVPVWQWLVVLAVWITLVVQERREKRALQSAKKQP